jgi:hypothetical protein
VSNGKKISLSGTVRECLDEPSEASDEVGIGRVEHNRAM